MSSRRPPRSISRELALLSLSQTIGKSKKLTEDSLNDSVVAAISILTLEVQDILATAKVEVKRGSDCLKTIENASIIVASAKAMVSDAIELAQTAIDRLRSAAYLPKAIKQENPNKASEYTSIRNLTLEVQNILETAAAEVQRGSDRLKKIRESEDPSLNQESDQAMISKAIELTQTAINGIGTAVELSEFIRIANQKEVREYTLKLIGTINDKEVEVYERIEASLVDWQFNRLPQIDQDILRIATAEIFFLDIPKKVAINEAVELAKKYSDIEGHRFINGVLRRVTEQEEGNRQKATGNREN